MEYIEAPGLWSSQDLIAGVEFLAGHSTLDKVGSSRAERLEESQQCPADKDLIEHGLNSPGDKPKYLLGSYILPVCLNWGELRASTISIQNTDLFFSLQIGL